MAKVMCWLNTDDKSSYKSSNKSSNKSKIGHIKHNDNKDDEYASLRYTPVIYTIFKYLFACALPVDKFPYIGEIPSKLDPEEYQNARDM